MPTYRLDCSAWGLAQQMVLIYLLLHNWLTTPSNVQALQALQALQPEKTDVTVGWRLERDCVATPGQVSLLPSYRGWCLSGFTELWLWGNTGSVIVYNNFSHAMGWCLLYPPSTVSHYTSIIHIMIIFFPKEAFREEIRKFLQFQASSFTNRKDSKVKPLSNAPSYTRT